MLLKKSKPLKDNLILIIPVFLNFTNEYYLLLFIEIRIILLILSIYLIKTMILSDAFDEVFMYQTLTNIQAGKTCSIPVYNYKTNSRSVYTFLNLMY